MTGKIWAVDYDWLCEIRAKLAGVVPGDVDRVDEPEDSDLDVIDGVAKISVRGAIMPSAPWWAGFLGLEVAAVDRIRADLREALARDDVHSIALMVDSPGGNVDGVDTLASEIRAARDQKPVHAAIGAMGASSAYWLSAQATTISAERTSDVGSIGVMAVLFDQSGAAEKAGVKVHVIRSGPDKGIGVDGAPVTAEHLAVLQEHIDSFASIFIESVAEGRGMAREAVEALATGRSWLGEQAQALGLIDRLEPSDKAVGRLAEDRRKRMTLEEQIAALKAEAEARKAELAAKDATIAKLQADAKAKAEAATDDYVKRLHATNVALGTCEKRAAQIGRIATLLASKDEAVQALAREMGDAILDESAPAAPTDPIREPATKAKKGRNDAFADVLRARGYQVKVSAKGDVSYRRPGASEWETK